MLSRVYNIFRTIFGAANHNGETEAQERFVYSRKRPADAIISDSSPNKRVCVESGIPFVSATLEKEGHPLRALTQDSTFPVFTKPDMRKSTSVPGKPKAGPSYRSTDFMDFKVPEEGFLSLRSSNQGKENITEISDNEDDEVAHQHVHTGMHSTTKRDSDPYWVNAIPTLNPVAKGFQHSCYRSNVKSNKDDNMPSKSSDFIDETLKWHILQSSTTSRQPNRIARGKLTLRPKRLDARNYTPIALTSSSIRGIQETIRLDEKNNYSKLLKHYEAEKSKQPTSVRNATHPSKCAGVFSFPQSPLVSFTKTRGKIELIDLTTKAKELASKVRRNHEVKPETMASKMASGSVGTMTPMITKQAITRINSFEDIIKLNRYYKPMFLEDTIKKFNEKKQETEKELQEPLFRAEQYARQNEKDMRQIEERMLRHIKITEAEVVLEDISEEEPVLPVLTPRMQKAIDAALMPTPSHEMLVEAFSLQITRHDMNTLAKLNWLNDEVINFYMNLLIERGKLENYPRVYAFNTFFYSKLISSGHVMLKRWTRKIDVFSHDIIIVPVHLGMHWCMASIDFRDKTIRYFDSMGNPNNKCLQALAKYLEDESMDKKKVPYDTSNWKKINVKDNPQQMNGSDCGVFACMYAEFICRNAKITFTQANMPYFRRKMVMEILSAKLLQCL